MKIQRKFLPDEAANAAVEFALIVPVLFTLILGILALSTLYFSQAAMHTAAEWAARYWAVSDAGLTATSTKSGSPPVVTTTYTDAQGNTVASPPVTATSFASPYSLSAQDWANQHYLGTNVTGLTFTGSAGPCTNATGSFGGPGFIMTATGTFNFNAMFVNFPISMSTAACYPAIQ